MTYRDQIVAAMNWLGQQDRVCFLGYNTRYGRAGGSLADVPEDRLFEMPLAENLMFGAAIGMSLDGRIPVVWCERADFLFCGMDAIVNHLNQIRKLSEGQHKPAAIIRVCIGNSKTPLFTGPTHTQDPSEAMRLLVSFPVEVLGTPESILPQYCRAFERAKKGISTMLFEHKDRYSET